MTPQRFFALRYEYGEHLAWRTQMGGFLPGWDRFSDPVQSVSRPLQMGPVCVEVRHRTGQPLDDRLWVEDPPASSFPACLAVKAAGLQSAAAAERLIAAPARGGHAGAAQHSARRGAACPRRGGARAGAGGVRPRPL